MITEEEKKEKQVGDFLNEGNMLFNKGEYREAIECYNKAIEISPKNANAHINKGVAFAELGEFDDAIQCYNKAIASNTNFAEAHNNKGVALVNLGKLDNAIQCYDKAIKINPKYAEAYSNKGATLEELDKFEDAVKCFDKAIEVNPKNAVFFNSKGAALARLEKLEEAIECCNKAININPNYADAYFNKGNILREQTKYLEAIECYTKAITINTNYSEAFYNKGKILDEVGEYQEATECYYKAIDKATNKKSTLLAYLNLGRIFVMNQEYSKALECYDKVIDINPLYTGIYYNKGVVKYYQKEYKEAGEYFALENKDILDILLLFDKSDTKVSSEIVCSMIDHKTDDYFWTVVNKDMDMDKKQIEECKQIYIQSLRILPRLHVDSELEGSVAHYTTKTATHILLLKNEKDKAYSNFRLSSIARANDPKEGDVLFEYLDISPEKVTTNDNSYQAFIGCFTFNHQSLNQFRLYGKENHKEASGVSMVTKQSFFSPKLELNNVLDKSERSEENKKKLNLFRCIYIDTVTDRVISIGHKEEYAYYRELKEKNIKITRKNDYAAYKKKIDEQLKDVKNHLKALKNAIKDLDPSIICELMLMLRYLIKHVAFKEEQECRILEIASLEPKGDNKNAPQIKVEGTSKMYIEYIPIAEHVDRLYMGNQFEDFGLFRDIIKHKCGKDSYLCDHPYASTI